MQRVTSLGIGRILAVVAVILVILVFFGVLAMSEHLTLLLFLLLSLALIL